MITLSEERVARLLLGQQVVVSIGEPWDFESPDGENVLRGRIRAVRSDEASGEQEIELEVSAFAAKGGKVDRLVARARYEEQKAIIERLASGKDAEVNFLYRTPEGTPGHLIGGFELEEAEG